MSSTPPILQATPAAFPNLKLTDVFIDEAAKIIHDIMRGKCVHAAADTIRFSFGDAYKSLFEGEAIELARAVSGRVKSVSVPNALKM